MAGGTALRVPVNFVQVMQRGGGKRGEGGNARGRTLNFSLRFTFLDNELNEIPLQFRLLLLFPAKKIRKFSTIKFRTALHGLRETVLRKLNLPPLVS